MRPLTKRNYNDVNIENIDTCVKNKSIKLRSNEQGKWTNHKKDKRRSRIKLKIKYPFRKVIVTILTQLSKSDKHAQVSANEGLMRYGANALNALL